MLLRICAATAAGALATQLAVAATTFVGTDVTATAFGADGPYTNSSAAETAFLGALASSTTEGFESFAAGSSLPLSVAFGTLSGGGSVITDTTFGDTAAAVGSQAFDSGGAVGGGGNFTFNLTTSANSFGAYYNDVGNIGNTLTFNLNGSIMAQFTVPSGGSSDMTYFGVLAGFTFNQIVFSSTISGDSNVLDNVTVGMAANVIPLPTAAGLASLGLLGLCVRRRRLA